MTLGELPSAALYADTPALSQNKKLLVKMRDDLLVELHVNVHKLILEHLDIAFI